MTTRLPRPRSRMRHGRPRRHPVPSAASTPVEQVLADARWHRLTRRRGTKGPLSARFAARRIVIADGPEGATAQHLPGAAARLVGEWRDTGEQKYYLTNHPPGTTLRAVAAAIKARWSCEQAHQQLKEDLGLDHFEGRTWLALHHHALLTMISFAFLQHLRLREVARIRRRGKIEPEHRGPPQPTLRAIRRALLARAQAVHLRCPKCCGRLINQPPA